MLKVLIFLAFASLIDCHDPHISERLIRMPNGDERELVSIDLRKRDGSEDIKLLAQVRFHLNASQLYVNGNPIRHNAVTQLRMRVTIIEIENGVRREPRLAPVIFRVLVVEKNNGNGGKQVIVEEEFIQVEENEVMQVEIKQIVWDAGKPMALGSILYKDSRIRSTSQDDDHHLFVADRNVSPHLPNERGYMDEWKHRHHHGQHHGHHHHHGHWRIMCWFRRLSMFGKICVVCACVVTLISFILSAIVCWKRHCHRRHPKTLVMMPMDNSIIVDPFVVKSDEKKTPLKAPDNDFHMEFSDDCHVDVSDKKKLVEE